jgi:hypothetical protein
MRHRALPILVEVLRDVTEECATADRGVPSRGVHLELLEMDEVDDEVGEGEVGEAVAPTARLDVQWGLLRRRAHDDRRDLVRRPWARHGQWRGRERGVVWLDGREGVERVCGERVVGAAAEGAREAGLECRGRRGGGVAHLEGLEGLGCSGLCCCCPLLGPGFLLNRVRRWPSVLVLTICAVVYLSSSSTRPRSPVGSSTRPPSSRGRTSVGWAGGLEVRLSCHRRGGSNLARHSAFTNRGGHHRSSSVSWALAKHGAQSEEARRLKTC